MSSPLEISGSTSKPPLVGASASMAATLVRPVAASRLEAGLAAAMARPADSASSSSPAPAAPVRMRKSRREASVMAGLRLYRLFGKEPENGRRAMTAGYQED